MHENYQETTSDKQKEYEILSKSNLDWTVLRLPLIVQTDVISKIGASIEDCKGRSVSASSLAEFISNEIENEEYIRKSPCIRYLNDLKKTPKHQLWRFLYLIKMII
jgi:hypothetical protein